MTSNDNIITVEIFNNRIQEIKTEIQGIRQEIKDTKNELLSEIRINQNDTAHLQTTIYYGFSILGLIIGLVGLIVAIIAIMPQLKHGKPEQIEDLSPRNIRDIRALIREEFSTLHSNVREI